MSGKEVNVKIAQGEKLDKKYRPARAKIPTVEVKTEGTHTGRGYGAEKGPEYGAGTGIKVQPKLAETPNRLPGANPNNDNVIVDPANMNQEQIDEKMKEIRDEKTPTNTPTPTLTKSLQPRQQPTKISTPTLTHGG